MKDMFGNEIKEKRQRDQTPKTYTACRGFKIIDGFRYECHNPLETEEQIEKRVLRWSPSKVRSPRSQISLQVKAVMYG